METMEKGALSANAGMNVPANGSAASATVTGDTSSAPINGSASNASTNGDANVAPGNNGVPSAPLTGGANTSINGNTPAVFINSGVPSTPVNGGPPSAPPIKSILSSIMVPMAAMAGIGSKREVGTIEIRRSPDRDSWITCRSGEEWCVENVAMIDAETNDGGNNTLFVVGARLLTDPRVQREVKLYSLHLAQTSTEEAFIWAVRHGEDNWAASSRAAVALAEKSWVRVVSSRTNGRYEIFSPETELNLDPVWPELTFDQILTIAMQNRLISSLDHAVLRRLRGVF